MKFIDVSNGLRQPISNEELALLDKIKDNKNCVKKGSLDERERQLAHELVKRGLLTRTKIDDKLHYVVDDTSTIWRI